ncbi:peptidoglycan-binding domain-containing protein [Bifidobacterium asteroides]|uniref:peptidoglycan-binding domain-containing protein n=1 Tax=Bifidobacterium asteroides TaxID=1684 RepID=UPI001C6A76FB|nr:peptidoglycan-binding domain-containing protein [Bifidobacterium asteroides]
MGTRVDGVVSGRVMPDGKSYARPVLKSCSYGKGGSLLIKAVQARLGLARDGLLGPATIRAIQAHLGVAQDGSFGPATVRALQARLNQGPSERRRP